MVNSLDNHITAEKRWFNALHSLLDEEYERLCSEAKVTKCGRSWLFDYLHNCDAENISFREYVESKGADVNTCFQ